MSPGQDDRGDESVVALVLARTDESVRALQSRLAGAGFTVGPASGPTFSITADAATFESTFGERPVHAADGGWTTRHGDELPLTALDDLAAQTVAVAFERPADLHGEGDGSPLAPDDL